MNRIVRLAAAGIVVLALAAPAAFARGQRVIDDSDRVVLRGNTHPQARPDFERGVAPPALPMARMIISMQIPADRRAALEQLLAGQQDPASPNYHRWLTPEEFGRQYGPDQADIDAVTGWLGSHGFTVEEVARGGGWINFSGTAAAVKRAFRTEIRDYFVDGRLHRANAADPEIPRGLSDLVAGVVTLHDFPRKSMRSVGLPLTQEELSPAYTSGGYHTLAPGDFATIYNVKPLYDAGIDGTGQTIAIAGRTHPSSANWATFRSTFGLPANPPQVVVNGTDPGDLGADEDGEADLDVEWSGAVARNAAIKFVVSKSTSATDGVDLSAQYIVNHNLAPVMSVSFGSCESMMGSSENVFFNNLWSQAAAQGITVFVSTGDAGAAGCNIGSDTTGSGRAVNGLASTPYNVAVGGTQFNEGNGSYWNAVNAVDGTSALSYIPETAWNESAGVAGGSGLWATGGGASSRYAKPLWQTAPGVPIDGKRDLPDVSLAAAGHDGYRVRTQGGWSVFGGTSASSPSFAGLMALVVQKTGQRQGNANPRFYQLASAQYGSAGTAVFHDTTAGNNSVPGVTGYAAAAGYDLATGLGSVDAVALVNNWVQLPDLTIASSHTGSFAQGQTGATYTLTVRNGGNDPTSGTVTITDTLPAGLTATDFSGSGWSCTLAPLTCARNDALASGGSYPPITLTVDVAANAPASLTNNASISGGGETNTANNTSSDSTTITPVFYTLNLLFAGNGAGTVTNQATATVCNANCSSAPIASGSSVILHAAPAQYSLFSGWSTCAGTGDCVFAMNGNASITATFSIDSARSVLCGPVYYPTLLAAYLAAPPVSATIEAWGIGFSEVLNLNMDKNFTLRGGFNGTYTSNTGMTAVAPPLTVTNGSVTVENVTVR
jgi:uncharacterized repeat protein (TIGR01451 family)